LNGDEMTTQEKIKIETKGTIILNDWEMVLPLEFEAGDWFAHVKFSMN
jgi:hypothetical protein